MMESAKTAFYTAPALLFLVVMCGLMLSLPRRFAVIPLLLTAFLMTLGQRFVVAGCYITFFRIVLLVGWLRVLFQQEAASFQATFIDKLFFWWVVVSLVAGLLLETSKSQLINRLGFTWDALGSFFLIRLFLRETEDAVFAVCVLAGICMVLSVFMLVEHTTARNVFSVLGGVDAITMVRDERLRCQGPFLHPILAGSIGATILPLCVGLFVYDPKYGRYAVLGIVATTIMTYTSASSGPLMAWIGGIIGLCSWPLRERMRTIRWGLALAVLGLHMVMKVPVWYLIGRLSSITGGTGYYRSHLIDQALRHLNEWWLWGTTTTAHWSLVGALPSDPRHTDITNHYVWEGVQGGLFKLGLFIALIVNCYQILGKIVHNPETACGIRFRFFHWALGCSLFAHVVSFISVAYFDQTIVNYYCLLALIANQKNWSIPQESGDDTVRPAEDLVVESTGGGQ